MERMRSKRTHLIAVPAVALAACVSGAVPAAASTITLGPPLAKTSTSLIFGSERTLAATSLGQPGFVQSPVDGVIVRWRIRAAVAVAGYAIRVLRRTGELEFRGDGGSAPVTPGGSGVETFDTNVPIHLGDYIGLDIPAGGQIGGVLEGGTSVTFNPRLQEGETRNGTNSSYELTFDAEVQPAPSVVLLSPASGSMGGGTSVTLAGDDFTGVTAVTFGATQATTFTVESEHRLTAIAPPSASAGPVDVTVTTKAGTSAATPDDRFTYETPLVTPSAKRTCRVPNLHGKTLKAAKRRAFRANCALGAIRKRRGISARTGRVVRQKPKPGTTLAAKGKIAITLG